MELGELPQDLMMEILGRVSFKGMLNSKGVCKRWGALISHPTFLKFRRRLRSQSSSNKQLANSIRLLVCSNYFPDMYIHTFPKTQLYLSSSNSINNSTTHVDKSGRTLKLTLQHKSAVMRCMEVISSSFLELVLLYMQNIEPAYLYNPSTEEFLSLPKTFDWENYFLSTMGLGHIDSTNEYKVVCVFEGLHGSQCEVFTLGSDVQWRIVAAPPYYISDDPGVFVAGGVYMFCKWVERQNAIARFDIEHEQWTTIPLPEGPLGSDLFIREVGGLFCLTSNCRLSADMWVLKDYKQGVWVLKNSIKYSYFLNYFNEEEYPNFYPLSLDYGNGKVLLVWIENNVGRQLISYDPETHNVEELQILYPTIDFTATLFTESFDSLL